MGAEILCREERGRYFHHADVARQGEGIYLMGNSTRENCRPIRDIAPADFEKIAEAIDEVNWELGRAMEKFPAFKSRHEGYAVILEELDELWQEIKHGSPERAREEAIQVAAMALRFLVDLYN